MMSSFYDPKLQQKLLLLQQQNRKLLRIAIWRCLIVSSFVASGLAIISSSYWQIKNSSQVVLEEDIIVADSTIYSLLKLNYPQCIWTIPSHQLSENLKSITPIVDAMVTKQMFPPQMKVRLQERVPVATVWAQGKIGFLDADGVWLEANFYRYSEENQNFSLPQLKVINFQTQYREAWSEIYRLLARYPGIELSEVRWDEVAHLYLKTNIGQVYLGSDQSLLAQQFQVLARFPELSTQEQLQGVEYLDLSNPEIPFIQKYTLVQ